MLIRRVEITSSYCGTGDYMYNRLYGITSNHDKYEYTVTWVYGLLGNYLAWVMGLWMGQGSIGAEVITVVYMQFRQQRH